MKGRGATRPSRMLPSIRLSAEQAHLRPANLDVAQYELDRSLVISVRN